MKNKNLLISLPLVLIVLMVYFTWNKRQELSRPDISIIKALPEFQLEDADGNPFALADLKGKVNVVDFIFTRCQGPCPIMSGEMTKLYKKYANNDDIRFVSISVDPDYDSGAVLKEYAKRYNVTDQRWIFLRGSMAEIVDLSENGFLLPAQNLPMGHTVRWVLVGAEGNIRGYYEGTDILSIEKMELAIKELL